jgi:hypothetical protein
MTINLQFDSFIIIVHNERERSIMEGNRELMRLASREERVKKVIDRVWQG